MGRRLVDRRPIGLASRCRGGCPPGQPRPLGRDRNGAADAPLAPPSLSQSLPCSLLSNAGPQCGDQCSPEPTSSTPSYFALFGIVVVPLLTLVETGFAAEIERHASFMVLGRLPVVPRLGVVIVTLVGIDAMNWCAHVANHRFTTLWRLHALHHSQEDMSVFTTFRTHPLVHATYLPALLPALVLGASGAVPAAALIAYGCLVTLPHANLPWRLGPIGRVVVSPAYHRIHHAA